MFTVLEAFEELQVNNIVISGQLARIETLELPQIEALAEAAENTSAVAVLDEPSCGKRIDREVRMHDAVVLSDIRKPARDHAPAGDHPHPGW